MHSFSSLILYSDKAQQHKERLLQFDREFARRTVVLDDQSDYYSSQNWLSEDEKREADERESQHVRDLHTRKKQQLDIVF